MITLTQQLDCARAVLAQMQAKGSRWVETQAAIVRTLERQLLLQEASDEMKGTKTEEVEI